MKNENRKLCFENRKPKIEICKMKIENYDLRKSKSKNAIHETDFQERSLRNRYSKPYLSKVIGMKTYLSEAVGLKLQFLIKLSKSVILKFLNENCNFEKLNRKMRFYKMRIKNAISQNRKQEMQLATSVFENAHRGWLYSKLILSDFIGLKTYPTVFIGMETWIN